MTGAASIEFLDASGNVTARREPVRMRIGVEGVWHQGSVVSACLADLGHHVVGLGDDAAAIAALNAGRAPVHEPGLEDLIARNRAAGRLSYSTDYAASLRGAELVLIALDTPVGADDAPELESVFAAASRIGGGLTGDVVLCVSAQVPVGTSERLAGIVRAASGRVCHVACVPEFLRLGNALESFREADRIVIGCDDARVAARVAALYEPLGRPMLRIALRSAEMAKHASNAFLATSISLINEIADLCEEAGADVTEVAEAMRLDRRIGRSAFLGAGLGFAGGTLGRDLRALQAMGREHGRATPIADAALAVNDGRAGLVVERLDRALGGLDGARIAMLGLTYKPGTSTLRRSVALEIAKALIRAGVEVRGYDPLADAVADDMAAFRRCASPGEAARDADALVLVTPWAGLDSAELAPLPSIMRTPLLLDTGNHLDPAALAAAGFDVLGTGRGAPRRMPRNEAARPVLADSGRPAGGVS